MDKGVITQYKEPLLDVVEYDSPKEIFNAIVEPELPELIQELIKIAKADLEDGLVRPKEKLEAIRYLADRILGRPATEVVQTQRGEVKVTVERIETRSKEEALKLIQSRGDVVEGTVRPIRE